MFQENSIETCILSRVKQIASPGWMHETSAQGWCTGKFQRDGMGWEVGGGSGWGTHVSLWLIRVNVWQKPLHYCKVISLQLIKNKWKKKRKQKTYKKKTHTQINVKKKKQRVPEKILFLLYWLRQSLWLCRSQQTVKNSHRDVNPRHLTCLLRNLYAGQETTGTTGHGTTDYFQIGKGVRQGCILWPCWFKLYSDHIM